MNGGGGAPLGRSNTMLGLGRDTTVVPHVCSFCRRAFATLQSLGGHMTTHRREMEELRRQHEAFMASQHLRLAPPAAAAAGSSMVMAPQHRHHRHLQVGHCHEDHCIQMIPLIPNHAFWESYRKAGKLPPLIDFMGVGYPVPLNQPRLLLLPQEIHLIDSSEDTLSEPAMSSAREEEGDEAYS